MKGIQEEGTAAEGRKISRKAFERERNEEGGRCYLFSCLFSCLCFRCCFNLSCRAGLLALGRKGCRPQKYHERYSKEGREGRNEEGKEARQGFGTRALNHMLWKAGW